MNDKFWRWYKGRLGDIWEFILNELPAELRDEASHKGMLLKRNVDINDTSSTRLVIQVPDASPALEFAVDALQREFMRRVEKWRSQAGLPKLK